MLLFDLRVHQMNRLPLSGCAEPYLDLSELPGALHPAGYVDCVAPDVVLRFPRPDHSGYHRAMINACGKTTRFSVGTEHGTRCKIQEAK